MTMACQLNRSLIFPKLLYFLFYAGIGSFLPFIPVIIKRHGLKANELAIIFGIPPLVGCVLRPIVGGIADKFQAHKAVLFAAALTSCVLFNLFMAVPNAPAIDKYDAVSFDVHCSDTLCTNLTCLHVPIGASSSLKVVNLTNLSGGIPQTSSLIGFNSSSFSGICRSGCFGNLSPNLSFASSSVQRQCSISDVQLYEQYGKELCNNGRTFTCSLVCGNDCTNRALQSENPHSFGKIFWMFTAINTLSYGVVNTCYSLVDAIAFMSIKDKNAFGKQRLFGSLGFLLSAVSVSIVISLVSRAAHFGTDQRNIDFTPAFLFYDSFILIMCAVFIFLKSKREEKKSEGITSDVLKLFSVAETVSFMALIPCFGTLFGVVVVYAPYRIDELHGDPMIMGFLMCPAVASEILVMYFAGKAVNFIGHVNCLYISLAVYVTSFFVMSCIRNPWLFLLTASLHGPSFGLMHVASLSYAAKITPAGTEATVQSIFGLLHFGIGRAIGPFLGGMLYERFGAVAMFRMFCGFAAVCILVHAPCNFLIHRLSKRKKASEPSLDHEAKGPEDEDALCEQPAGGAEVRGANTSDPGSQVAV